MNSKAILVFSSLALSPSLVLAQTPSQTPTKLDPEMEAVQQKFNIFDQDFSAYNKIAQDDAIAGPKKLELSVKMKADAQAWFSSMQNAYVAKVKENKSLSDQNRNLNDQITMLRKENADLTRRTIVGEPSTQPALVLPLKPLLGAQPQHPALQSHPIK